MSEIKKYHPVEIFWGDISDIGLYPKLLVSEEDYAVLLSERDALAARLKIAEETIEKMNDRIYDETGRDHWTYINYRRNFPAKDVT